MFSLFPPRGSLPVGAVTLVAPVNPPLAVGAATLAPGDVPAFVLDELAFTVYYPAAPVPTSRKGLGWLVRFVLRTIPAND
jgi:platelet-activating factor acetylhydrolase